MRELLGAARRYGAIRNAIPELSDRLLSTRLKQLESEGVVERYQLSHRHIEYHLTPKGEALRPVVYSIERWAERYLR